MKEHDILVSWGHFLIVYNPLLTTEEKPGFAWPGNLKCKSVTPAGTLGLPHQLLAPASTEQTYTLWGLLPERTSMEQGFESHEGHHQGPFWASSNTGNQSYVPCGCERSVLSSCSMNGILGWHTPAGPSMTLQAYLLYLPRTPCLAKESHQNLNVKMIFQGAPSIPTAH